MKRILTILRTITLIVTSTISLVACNSEYSEEQLKKLKEENKININGNTLEWIAPQEKPFINYDDKWYIVVWRIDKGHDWRIVKFNNNINLNIPEIKRNLDNLNGYNLNITNSGIKGTGLRGINLNIYKSGIFPYVYNWEKNDDYFKAVYRWYGKYEPDKLVIDPKTGKVTDWKKIKK